MDSQAVVSRARRRHTSDKSLGIAVSVVVALAWVESVMTGRAVYQRSPGSSKRCKQTRSDSPTRLNGTEKG